MEAGSHWFTRKKAEKFATPNLKMLVIKWGLNLN